MRWLFESDREVELAYLAAIHKDMSYAKHELKMLREDIAALKKKKHNDDRPAPSSTPLHTPPPAPSPALRSRPGWWSPFIDG
jgi:hypothetical protein